jgi:putative membrane protein
MGLYDMMSGWGAGWWSWTMYLGMIVFWAGVVALVIWGVRAVSGSATGQSASQASPAPRESAAEVLKRRYAAGEIDAAEFEEKRRNLF